MKKNKISTLFVVAIMACVALFASCSSDDDKEVFIAGDTTTLKKDLDASYDTLSLATPDKYTQQSMDEFKTKLDLISGVIEKGDISQQEVINMDVYLNKALTTFLNSKMSGISEDFLIAGWGFDQSTESSTLVGDGTRKLVATFKAGPSQIFGTDTQLPQFVDEGVNGKAIYFNKGAHLEIEQYTPADFLGKQLSIAVWLKPDVVKGGSYVASLNYWNNWKFQIQEQAKSFFTVGTTGGTTDADNEKDLSVPKNTWTHVVVVLNLDESTLAFYVNGILTKEWTKKEKPALVGSQSPAYQSPLGAMLPLMIGASTTYEEAKAAWSWGGWDTPATWDYFQGAMDEIKFYNIAISSGQVKWLYNKEATLLM